jgi:hypothetical protein
MDEAASARRGVARAAVLAGVGVTLVGAFLPWIVPDPPLLEVPVSSRPGTEADGHITLALAYVALGVMTVRGRARFRMAVVTACGIGIAAVGVAYAADLAYGYEILPADGPIESVGRVISDPGTGVYVTVLGGLLVLAGGIAGLLRR